MIIIPAILDTDSAHAITQIGQLRGVTQWIQVDLSDNTMTNSATLDLYDLVGEMDGFDVEVHLMTTTPEKYLDACAAINARRVYFHLGEVESPSQALSAMDSYDFTKGIVLSPQTTVEDVFTYIDEIDAVQVMTVVPGAQSGEFLGDMLGKVSYLRERRGDIWISVDGGVNQDTITKMKEIGVDAVSVGSAIMKQKDVVSAYNKLEQIIETK